MESYKDIIGFAVAAIIVVALLCTACLISEKNKFQHQELLATINADLMSKCIDAAAGRKP